MVVIFAYSSYMLADSFGLSGIVAILFCGLVSYLGILEHFKAPNVRHQLILLMQWYPAAGECTLCEAQYISQCT